MNEDAGVAQNQHNSSLTYQNMVIRILTIYLYG